MQTEPSPAFVTVVSLIDTFYSLICSVYVFEVNILFSNYAEIFFSTQTKYLSFSMRAHALNGGPRVIIQSCNVLTRRKVRG